MESTRADVRPLSSSESRWTALNGASPFDLRFAGTDASGLVIANGTGANARVPRLPAIATGVLANSPTLPHVAADGRTLVIAPSSVVDDVYVLNTATLQLAELDLTRGSQTRRYDVETAALDPDLEL